MSSQKEINVKMRTILIDWLMEVVQDMKLSMSTLFLSVNIIDRYLSLQSIERDLFQLLGVAALLIASKLEEVQPRNVDEMADICDGAYSVKQVAEMELACLQKLNFCVSVPTLLYFANRLLVVCDLECKDLVHYFLSICLLRSDVLKFPYSIISTSCIVIALHWTRLNCWVFSFVNNL